ncbi:aspartate aminotransferase family protein [Methanobrevibacter olleyae]|uniref:Acetylornithine aminotransferase n=1 Tax=Methanobrevibacter olleyae TaxID=294671 RepID=A0A126R1C4_METOL|nr:aspartate aminotransferase family protein [Methanobrevibacter olleyae]AMK16081.1 acetylornithine aminotransferase ArgD [Methanobrevibacter olleyae]SFL75339.1 acetylornithine/N-succinyldiaminopimelate aminotransferase [Methanobrevibacter olleyae]
MKTEEIIDIEDKYFINTFNRVPIVLDHGEGVKVWDIEDKEYLDFLAGIAVNCLGHNHPKLVGAIQEQAEKLIHISSIYYNEPATVYAKRLVDATCFDRIFFANSGAEANEGAIKLALKYSGKSEVLFCGDSFHGRTFLTLSVTDHPEYSAPYVKNLPKGFKKVEFANLESVAEAITDETAAIIIEPVQGEGGVHIATEEFYKGLNDLCKEKGVLIIVDEVQSGFGRCGALFAHELFGLKPDIMTVAKGIGGGFPMAAFLATEEVATGFVPGDHGTTFAGSPLAGAAANAVFDVFEEENLVEHSKEMGEYFIQKLSRLKDKYDFIDDVRGVGLLVGIELNFECGDLVGKMLEEGFLINSTAGNVLRFAPPLIVKKAEIDALIDALDKVFDSL